MTISDFILKNSIVRGNIPLFSKKNALELIKLCKLENKTILGIDSFIVSPSAIQPVSEESIDFSYNKNSKSDYCNEAYEFINSKSDGKYYYEVVFK